MMSSLGVGYPKAVAANELTESEQPASNVPFDANTAGSGWDASTMRSIREGTLQVISRPYGWVVIGECPRCTHRLDYSPSLEIAVSRGRKRESDVSWIAITCTEGHVRDGTCVHPGAGTHLHGCGLSAKIDINLIETVSRHE